MMMMMIQIYDFLLKKKIYKTWKQICIQSRMLWINPNRYNIFHLNKKKTKSILFRLYHIYVNTLDFLNIEYRQIKFFNEWTHTHKRVGLCLLISNIRMLFHWFGCIVEAKLYKSDRATGKSFISFYFNWRFFVFIIFFFFGKWINGKKCYRIKCIQNSLSLVLFNLNWPNVFRIICYLYMLFMFAIPLVRFFIDAVPDAYFFFSLIASMSCVLTQLEGKKTLHYYYYFDTSAT